EGGEIEKAIEAFQRAIEIEPTEWAYNGLGFIYHEYLFKFELAFNCYKIVLEMNPDELLYCTNFTEANFTSGRFKEAYDLAQKIFHLLLYSI
ncbi:MAG: tetratricopeptide repeat protein, partial [Promethearchaeota archaeon]